MKNIWNILLLLFVLFPATLVAQQRTVSGKVIDETGEPMTGVTVKVVNTGDGTITDIDGNYSLRVPAGNKLQFSFLGYVSKTVEVKNTVLNVTLQPDEQLIDEVVVVGYGVQKKASVVGAISSVGTKDLVKMSTPTLTTALTGQLPGVTTIQTSAIPGVDETEIYIRGKGTWADASPLIIVDGIERATFTNIDPHEVESISVLKDASATAVYGVKGANGVVLITTIRGSESKPRVNFSMTVSGVQPTRMPKFINSYETAMLRNEALINDGLDWQTMGFSAGDLQHFQAGDDIYHYPNVDWVDLMVNDFAIDQKYNLNVQGGTKNVRYFVSLGYLNQGGMFKTDNDMGFNSNFGFQRLNYRSNIDVNVTNDLTLSLDLAARIENRRGPGSAPDGINGQMLSAFAALYTLPPYDTPVFQKDGTPGYGIKLSNPWLNLNRTGYQMSMNDVLESAVTLNYKLDRFVKGLSLKGRVSYDSGFGSAKQFRLGGSQGSLRKRLISPYGSPDVYEVAGEDQPLQYDNSDNYIRMNTSNKIYFDASVFYDRKFGKHGVSALLLYNQSQEDYPNTWGNIPHRYQGFVGRATYNYNNRYFAEFNVGRNGSENFHKDKRFGWFPAFSLGYLVSEEDFFQRTFPNVQTLKIRGSYGIVGNDKIGGSRFLYTSDYASWRTDWYEFMPNFGVNSGGQAGAIHEGTLPNLLVTWEKAEKSNLGIELSAWKGLLSVNADVFYEQRNNILMERRSVQATLGIAPPPGNVGQTENKGFELEIGHRNKLTQNFTYWLKTSMSYAKNKIVNYDEPSGVLPWQVYAGQAIGQYRGLQADGFFYDQAEIDNYKNAEGEHITYDFGNPKPGDYKYKDINNDGRINEYDYTAIGYTRVPEYNFTFQGGVNVYGFDFSMLWQGATKVSLTMANSLMREFLNNGRVQEHHFNRWAYYTNPITGELIDTRATATYPRLTTTGNSPSWQLNSASLYNGEYIKLRSVELGYSIPEKWTKKLHINAIRLFASGNNLLIFSHVKNIDPEGFGSVREYNYPQTASYNFGLNITF
ncbi:MAG: TonB-dependent receptor [Dysgonamonadaceae bacterium]|jgi:TonB-linked SusC/RagA family outer membrane protein|nr:TonB-dependent receptor [Dysgonamonadaceae bacterium]